MCVFVLVFYFFLGFTWILPVCIFFFFLILLLSWSLLILLLLIDDIVNDCLLIMTQWIFNIGLYAVFSFSPAPPTASSQAEPVCSSEVRLICAARCGDKGEATQTLQMSVEKGVGGVVYAGYKNQNARVKGRWDGESSRFPWCANPSDLHSCRILSFSVNGPRSHWCFMFNSGSTQLHF